jgi:hypothetical protein
MVLFGGCATVRTYPICLYDTNLGAAEAAERNWPTLRSQLSETLSLATNDPDDVVVIHSRVAVARTTVRQDNALRSLWPPIACYGLSAGTTSSELLAACQVYIRALLEADRSGQPLPANVVVPACQTFLSEAAATTTNAP